MWLSRLQHLISNDQYTPTQHLLLPVRQNAPDVWESQALESGFFLRFKERLSAEDKAFFRNETADPNQISASLLAELDKQSASSHRFSSTVVNRTKQLAKIFAIFTTSVPELSTIYLLDKS
jgi:hypothetical protein